MHIGLYMQQRVVAGGRTSWPPSKFWSQIRNPTSSVNGIYLRNNPAKFHPDLIWNDGTLGLYEDRRPTRTRITITRWVAILGTGSVHDPKMETIVVYNTVQFCDIRQCITNMLVWTAYGRSSLLCGHRRRRARSRNCVDRTQPPPRLAYAYWEQNHQNRSKDVTTCCTATSRSNQSRRFRCSSLSLWMTTTLMTTIIITNNQPTNQLINQSINQSLITPKGNTS